MSEPITVTDLVQAGRLQAPDPSQPRVFVTYNADFSAPSDIVLDFTIFNQQQVFGIARALFIDNGSNPEEVEVSVSGTDQFFTVPPFAQGIFKIDAINNSRIRFVTTGGASDQVTITVYNWEVAPSVWYRFGAFNKDTPVKVQGTQPSGTDMGIADNNNPVYLGGASNIDGSLVPVSVDATGRVRVVGAAVGGNVFGTDPLGAPPTADPVFIAGLSLLGGNIAAFIFDGTNLMTVEENSADILAELQSIANNTPPIVSGTANVTSVPSATIDTLILNANANREGLIVFNNGTANLYLRLSAGAATLLNASLVIPPLSYWELPFKYYGEVRAIWDAVSGSALITEAQ